MSQDLNIGKLSEIDKDVLMNLHENYNKKKMQVNIRKINFKNVHGKPISKSTLYKSLKALCQKNIISHLGSSRSCVYKLN